MGSESIKFFHNFRFYYLNKFISGTFMLRGNEMADRKIQECSTQKPFNAVLRQKNFFKAYYEHKLQVKMERMKSKDKRSL